MLVCLTVFELYCNHHHYGYCFLQKIIPILHYLVLLPEYLRVELSEKIQRYIIRMADVEQLQLQRGESSVTYNTIIIVDVQRITIKT